MVPQPHAASVNPELAQTLEQLRYIHLPNDSLWWPPAPGKIFLLIIIVTTLFFICKKISTKLNNYYQSHPIKQALKELIIIDSELQLLKNSENIEQDYNNLILLIQKTSALLKKSAINKYKNQNINNLASLSGQNWLDFLNQTGKTHEFHSPEGQLIISAAYSTFRHDKKRQDYTALKIKTASLIKLTKQWLKTNL